MLPEIAHFSLLIALVLAIALSIVPLAGTFMDENRLIRSAKPLALGLFGYVLFSFICLIYLFLENDFSVKIVAQHSNLSLPAIFRVTAIWGGHEGSMLLWILILVIWTAAVALFSRQIPDDMVARVLSIMGMIATGFLLFSLLTSNPFERILPNIPIDGKDLNPLLQDFGMVIHPPMLYFGYVGFSVAFAFAIAALISGEFDSAWVRWTRPWTTAAWGFLSLGIALGSWWAYYELGWGGWWFWDPVENASFMPWLVGTALMHSLAVTEQRGMFKSWTILLAIFTFSLSLLGTFLVRSGVLTSVHAFAADPGRGLFILAFLGLVVGGSLILFAFRAPTITGKSGFTWLSREMFLLVNNALLVVAALTVLIGTLYPLIADVFKLGKYSVGPPYFNSVFVPIMLILITFLAIGPLLRWKNTDKNKLFSILKFIFPMSIVLTLFLTLVYGAGFHVATLTGFAMVSWLLSAIIYDLWQKTRYASSFGQGLKRLTLSYYGMQLGHIGLVVIALGVAIVSQMNIEKDVKMFSGEEIKVGEYQFHFKGSEVIEGPNYSGQRGHFQVYDEDGYLASLYPEKRRYHSQMGNVMTEAAIDATLSRDLFVALGEPLPDSAWAVRIQYKPFIRLIWLGALLMSLGAILVIFDKRYR